ncbi:MAG: 3-phosphoshikimate 1-carboxyvinyltransferase [Kouleothrix sp.]|jgi:3-phosphoshikimate 1-carboxyvinyltransferase|nr:3-phosphoshikimate 1-carboxyvinyltransferase [Kouleothrix sp.]
MTTIAITPALRPLDALARIPGSKSITNRALLLAALAEGVSTLEGVLFSDDSHWFIDGLQRLGVAVEADRAAEQVRVHGLGAGPPATAAELWVELAGTAARFLLAYAALGQGHYTIDGNARMRQRPMADLIGTLNRLGSYCHSLGEHGGLPIRMEACGLRGGMAELAGDKTSQFLSALLMVAPYAERDVELVMTTPLAATPYIDMTTTLMAAFGATVERVGYERFQVRAGQRYAARAYRIEPDASNASYFFAAAAATAGRVRVAGLGRDAIQGDVAFLAILEQMGCTITAGDGWIELQGPAQLRGVDVDLSKLPDMAITLAALAPFADRPTTIRNVALIRHHETDRIAALVTELRKLGVVVNEYPDGLAIEPGWQHGAVIDSHHDHRMAMGFAVAGLKIPGLRIAGAEAVAKTFPDFFERFADLLG